MVKIKEENVLSVGYDLIRSPLEIKEEEGHWQQTLENHIKEVAEEYAHPAICLSGGMDSSIVAFYMSKYNPHVAAYTLVINDDNVALKEAKEIASRLKIDHDIRKIHITKREIQRSLPHIFQVYYPFDKGSLIPVYELFKRISNEPYDIVFFGDGADELFGGYKRHLTREFNFTNHLEIFNEIELHSIFGHKLSTELKQMQKNYREAKSLEDYLKLEFRYEFPNAHLLKMEKFSNLFDMNTCFPFLHPKVMGQAMNTENKIDYDRRLGKFPLYKIFFKEFNIKRKKIPLKFKYLDYISTADIEHPRAVDYLEQISPTTRNFNRKIWITYLLEQYEKVK